MGGNRAALGLVVTLLVLAGVPSALLGAGASRADASTCGSLNRGSGAPASGGELSSAAFVSAGEVILTVTSGKTLAVGDVNGDHNPDSYVVCGRTGTENAPDYLLLGNATGGFTAMAIPETTAGGCNRAYPIDYTRDGLTSFLVLNGQVPNRGPIQLLMP